MQSMKMIFSYKFLLSMDLIEFNLTANLIGLQYFISAPQTHEWNKTLEQKDRCWQPARWEAEWGGGCLQSFTPGCLFRALLHTHRCSSCHAELSAGNRNSGPGHLPQKTEELLGELQLSSFEGSVPPLPSPKEGRLAGMLQALHALRQEQLWTEPAKRCPRPRTRRRGSSELGRSIHLLLSSWWLRSKV